jgi:hypothetical protein
MQDDGGDAALGGTVAQNFPFFGWALSGTLRKIDEPHAIDQRTRGNFSVSEVQQRTHDVTMTRRSSQIDHCSITLVTPRSYASHQSAWMRRLLVALVTTECKPVGQLPRVTSRGGPHGQTRSRRSSSRDRPTGNVMAEPSRCSPHSQG